jgi:iron complex outermembrane receptor protein
MYTSIIVFEKISKALALVSYERFPIPNFSRHPLMKATQIILLPKLLKLGFLSLLVIGTFSIHAAELNQDNIDKKRAMLERLKKLNLQELGKVQFYNPEATSAARKTQKLLDTPSALFVLSQEDIRRAGITTIPEALRMVPGMQVARVYANRWAISTRGMNGLISSKLLVMIDGRTVYTPYTASVFWDVQDLLIEDIDRIEVIRGPGASLWGANAVNGIINIITKPAQETQGNLVTTYLGTGEEQAIVGVRHGGKIKNIHYRVYGKFYQHESFVDAKGHETDDNWEMKRGGFHADWQLSQRDQISLQGDVYDGFEKQTSFLPLAIPRIENFHTYLNGFNLLGRWKRKLAHGDMILQTYYDFTERNNTGFLEEERGTYDIDFQHRWQRNERQELIWGLGFRYTHDDFKNNSFIIEVEPDQRQDNLFSAFVQAEFILQPERWKMILGSKFEHNDYTGFEYQPTARLLWTPHHQHSGWASVSRAVRSPSRYDSDNRTNTLVPDPLFGNLQIKGSGNPDFEAEVMLASELGYRFTPNEQFFLDSTLFYNDYEKLRTFEATGLQPFPLPPTMYANWDNQMTGEVYGLEMAAHWQASKAWRVVATYSYVNIQLHLLPTSQNLFGESEEGDTPHHQATLRSLLSLPKNLEFDTALYYVDNVPSQNTPHYTRFDVRLGWQPQKSLNLSLGARNLFDNQHPEFGSGLSGNPEIASEVQRAFYLQLNYQF